MTFGFITCSVLVTTVDVIDINVVDVVDVALDSNLLVAR